MSEKAKSRSSEAGDKPDIPALMAEIRARVADDVSKNGTSINIAPAGAQDLLHSEELRALNRFHGYPLNINPLAISSHRPGIIGRLIVSVKRKLLSMLKDSLLREYFQAEFEFQTNLVRYLNELTKRVESAGRGPGTKSP